VGLRWTGAGLLGVAAVAKAWQAPILLRGDGILSNPFLLDAVIVFEVVAAAIVLVSSFRVCWWMIVAVFGSFSVVSAIALLTGSDCNCFGTWGGAMVTLPIDLGMLVACALVWWRDDVGKMGRSELSRSFRVGNAELPNGLLCFGMVGAPEFYLVSSLHWDLFL
jgi:hypothetical protein